MPAAGRVLLGEIVAAHGVRGLVKVRSHTERPDAIGDYGVVFDETGRELALQVRGPVKGGLLVAIDGVSDRTQAEALVGTGLYVARAALQPADDDEEAYYQVDLIGLAARLADGSTLGRVRSVENYGGGDMLDIETTEGGRSVLVPFTRDIVPTVDLEAGYLVIDPIPGLLD